MSNPMDTLRLEIEPRSAFGGPIKGDTLFGQLCWAIVHRRGTDGLNTLLEGYSSGQPFLVCSDAFPTGFLSRPTLPLDAYQPLKDHDRKSVKKRQWLPLEHLAEPTDTWLAHCREEREVVAAITGKEGRLMTTQAQPHNSIHRQRNTTHGGEFAPYTMPQHWFASGLRLDIWIRFDSGRISQDEVSSLMEDIGATGYGRDASIGLGKFTIHACESTSLKGSSNANALMTLAPCAPQGQGFDAARSFYEPFTRFGRHGDRAVHSGRPFKSPLLLANTGAILSGNDSSLHVTGQGLGGDGTLSNAITATVHQGYAPCVGIHLREPQS